MIKTLVLRDTVMPYSWAWLLDFSPDVDPYFTYICECIVGIDDYCDCYEACRETFLGTIDDYQSVPLDGFLVSSNCPNAMAMHLRVINGHPDYSNVHYTGYIELPNGEVSAYRYLKE
jgi:Fe-S-cluster formation regulator IscX/YfhJ